MPVTVEASPRTVYDYEEWFDKQAKRFYRQELRDFAFVADIFHFFRRFKDGEADIKVTKRYGEGHKKHRLSFQLHPEDIVKAQDTTPEITDENKALLDMLSGTRGLQVIIDLKRVTTKEPFGFTMELSPVGEEEKSFVSHLINPPIVFDRESKEGESFDPEILMSVYCLYENYDEVTERCGSLYTYAHKNPGLVHFLKNTSFWMDKVISRRLGLT